MQNSNAGPIYLVPLTTSSLSTANGWDVLQLTADSSARFELVGFNLAIASTQFTSGSQLSLQILRGSTAASTGSAITPRPVIRPIAPAIADLLLAEQQAHATKMAERMVQETIREVNRERTRLLTKDQLRLLVFGQDTDIAKLAAADILTREPASNRTLSHANGDIADIGYSNDGDIYAHVYRAGAADHWLPPSGKA